MENISIKNCIKIQRCYRSYKIKILWKKIILNYDLNNNSNINFFSYTKIIRDKNLLILINKLLEKIEIRCKKKININNRTFLTCFLIKNFVNELIGKEEKRNNFEENIYLWSKKYTEIINELENISYNKLNLFITFTNNYDLIFKKWKDYDKDLTIENCIKTYYNNKIHIDYIKNENTDDFNSSIIVLENECNNILQNIKIIDKTFDIEYFKKNYKIIHDQIVIGKNKIMIEINKKFREIYKEILVNDLKSFNNTMIYKLINEINNRILISMPIQIKNSVKKKIDKYNFFNILLKYDWTTELLEYFNFIFDTIIVLLPTNDNSFNTDWKNEMNTLFNKSYKDNLPVILLEINKKIDLIFELLNSI